jgi:plastocyanin
MQVAWTNRDVVDHIILLERVDKDGDLVDSGGTDLLQPGSTFSITLTEPGQYTYYCSEDRALSGTITVSP